MTENESETIVLRNSTITFSKEKTEPFKGSEIVVCQNCFTLWEDEKAAINCPCLDEY